jgi:peptidoglycan hydrolase CwlO-like protein
MNNKFFITAGIGVITIFIITVFAIAYSGYDYIQNTKIRNKYNITINEKDSCIYELNEKLLMQNIEVENYKDSIIIYKDSINSLINELDSVNEELQINKIKIERIREYNRIAAQGNNIKFLRGWINRVIN